MLLGVIGFTQELIKLPRLNSEIKLDGIVNEPAWDAIEPLPLVMYQPTYRGAITESTEIRVAYDDNYIYMSGRLYQNNPADIRANSLYRDRYSGDDTFAIVLDSFNDNENALWFFVNPLGTRYDFAVSNDAVGGFNAVNSDWNTFWDVATSITDEGWFAEIRIPFSSLGFQDDNGQVVMGLIVYRFIAVSNTRYVYPDIPPTWDRGSNKPSVAQDVLLENVYSKKPVYITPYILGGANQLSTLNNNTGRYELDTDRTNEAGLDIKYNLTSNLTLDITANTDFAQVEADDQQINLTRFSLFFPEKRQFFQERAGIFDFRLGGDSRLFHSRRIGLNEGQPIRIYGGARIVGRLGKWDFGFLNMQTAKSDSLPSENFGVLRLRRNVINANSDIGAMLTTRLGDDGNYNLAYGVDASLRLWGDDYLAFKWAQNLEKEIVDNNHFDALDASRFFISMQRQRFEGFAFETTVSWSGKDFDPGIGFDTRRDFLYAFNALNYQWFMKNHSSIRKIWFGNQTNTYFRNNDNSVESASTHPFVEIEANNGGSIQFFSNHFYEDVRDGFSLSTVVNVPLGKYGFHEAGLSLNAPEGWRLRPGLTAKSGSFYDGKKHTIQLSPTWNLSRFLELSGFYEINLLRFGKRDQSDNIHLARLRLNTALNNLVSLNGFLQYSSNADLIAINARFRYNFSEGNDLWLVYNEGLNTERTSMEFPASRRLPLTDNRTVMLKYTHTFIR